MVGVFERVYAIGNVYRAEKHSTTRHLNEYTSMDMEMGFIHDHRDLMVLETRFMHALIKQLRMNCEKRIQNPRRNTARRSRGISGIETP